MSVSTLENWKLACFIIFRYLSMSLKLKSKKLNHGHILYPPWNSQSLKAEKLNDHYIPQQSSFLKLVSRFRSYIWIFLNSCEAFSHSSGNLVTVTRTLICESSYWALLKYNEQLFHRYCPKNLAMGFLKAHSQVWDNFLQMKAL